jgi:hypothetical protein
VLDKLEQRFAIADLAGHDEAVVDQEARYTLSEKHRVVGDHDPERT